MRLRVPDFWSTGIKLLLQLVLELNLVCWRGALSRGLLIALVFYVTQEGLTLILRGLLKRSRWRKPHTSSTIDRGECQVVVRLVYCVCLIVVVSRVATMRLQIIV